MQRWCSGESLIQVMRGPRWEADSLAWYWPIVMGTPEREGETPLMKKEEFSVRFIWGKGDTAYHNSEEQAPQRQRGRFHPLLLRVRGAVALA